MKARTDCRSRVKKDVGLLCAHTRAITHTHTHNPDTEATVAETRHQMSPCDVSLSFVSASLPFSPPPISRALSQEFLFQRGKLPYSYTRHTIPTNHQPCPTALLFPSPSPNPRSPAVMRKAPPLAKEKRTQYLFCVCFFFMSDGKITSTKEGHSEERVVFRVSELNKLYFSSLCFLLLLLSSSLSSILASPRLSFMYFCLVFSSPLTCSHRFLLFSTCRPENSKPCHANRLT